MDEPTNHLDLPSIRCQEDALTGCPCVLVLVSHDEAFLRKLTQTNWQFTTCDSNDRTVVLRIVDFITD